MQKALDARIWRLKTAFRILIAGAALCVLLYFRGGGIIHLGLGWALVLAAVILHSSIRQSALLADLEAALVRFSDGDLRFRLYSNDLGNSFSLTQAFNRMAAQLEKRIDELSRKLEDQDAVLSSMSEGVIAVDGEERIIRMNETACVLMQVSEKEVIGRSVQEVVRNADLLKFIGSAHLSREPIEADIVVRDSSERILHAYGKTLRDSQWNTIGILIVFSDITRLRHLENVRKDFVANVSHELRTPITSIKGFIETLADGAIDNPADARRFLDILARQADRLNAIFEDLLTLSRIEEGGRQGDMRLEPGNVAAVVKTAIETCRQRALDKRMQLESSITAELPAQLNENLLEQAITNLVENAIKYSDEGTVIRVEAGERDGEIFIHVIDHGPGIEKNHLPRLFERFYRVDRARTRKAGGTGLGLAIVKHIAECHQGRATVDSTPGQGSTFSIYLPLQRSVSQDTVH